MGQGLCGAAVRLHGGVPADVAAMFFGARPYRWDGQKLRLSLSPFVPDYLMPGDGVVRAVFMGRIPVTYHASGLAALIPGETVPVRWILSGMDGMQRSIEGSSLPEQETRAVRNGEVVSIDIEMRKCERNEDFLSGQSTPTKKI